MAQFDPAERAIDTLPMVHCSGSIENFNTSDDLLENWISTNAVANLCDNGAGIDSTVVDNYLCVC